MNNFTDTDGTTPTGELPFIAEETVYGVYLKSKERVVATHHDISLLRQCKTVLSARPDHRIHIVSAAKTVQIEYIIKTLLHLGVSCSKIDVDSPIENNDPNGVWLFVAKDKEPDVHNYIRH